MEFMKHRRIAAIVSVVLLVSGAVAGNAQAAATRYLGAVTAIDGNKLTVKTTQGDEHQVEVPSTAEVKRIEPGQTNLSSAVDMPFSQIATGDRVLVWVDPNAASGTPQALRIVAIKAGDLAKKQQQEAAAWQNGVGGLVKSVDPAAGTIVVTSGAGPSEKSVIIHIGKTTVLKRYAPRSVSYAAAQPAPLTAIHPGDQLKARGSRSPDGDFAADEVVSGSFRNISGLIASLDPSNQTFVVKDLATKKQVTIEVPADAQMRELPERMAQMLAVRLKGAQPANNAAPVGNTGQRGGFTQRGGGGAGMAMDPQQMLNRAPAIHFTDLKKGDAVMLVATIGDSEVTAITLLDGVEALLEAPASQDLLANWSMGSGGGDAGADAGTQ